MVSLSRYTPSNLLRALKNPRLIRGDIRRRGVNINSSYHKKTKQQTSGDVTIKDWDNLVILDACRFDAYLKVTDGVGSVTKRISNATDSREFMRKNFQGKELWDTVYITANPFATRLNPRTFFLQKNLVETDWDADEETVLPEDVVRRTLETLDEYPNKRYIIHFMQPHYPFIGDKGRRIEHSGYTPEQASSENDNPHIWTILQYGLQGFDGVTTENVWEAYIENLEIALDHVDDLLSELLGKTVITADHGTMIGDRLTPVPVRGFGHSNNPFVPPVWSVPWDVVINNNRREILEDFPVEREKADEDVIKNRLKQLGYRDV